MHVRNRAALTATVVLAAATILLSGVAAAQRPPSAVREGLAGAQVPLDRLEDRVDQYMGLTIVVEGRVDEVLGPRLFRIADRTADGDVLVGVLAPDVAPVMTGDHVRITGRLQPLAHDDFERSWNWLGLGPEAALDMALRPVLVAARVTANRGGGERVLSTDPVPAAPTAGDAVPATPISDVSRLAHGDRALVGRAVELRDITVTGHASPGGFFIEGPERHVLVLTGHGSAIPHRGERLSAVQGVVLELPDNIAARVAPPGPMNDAVYLFTTRIQW